jgi:hypothetical protein
MLAVDIVEGTSKLQLLNIYNESDQARLGPKTLERCLYSRTLQPSTILLGDFNTHHPWWDPLAKPSPNADELVNWIENQELALLNTPGEGTFFRPQLARESVLDLTLVSSNLAELVDDWQILPDLGSDYYGILFTIRGTSTSSDFDNSNTQTRFNTQLADWPRFSEAFAKEIENSSISSCSALVQLSTISQSSSASLELLQDPNLEIGQILQHASDSSSTSYSDMLVTDFLDQAAESLTTAITTAAKIAIPIQKTSAKAKPWWNDELRELRQTMLQCKRQLARDFS